MAVHAAAAGPPHGGEPREEKKGGGVGSGGGSAAVGGKSGDKGEKDTGWRRLFQRFTRRLIIFIDDGIDKGVDTATYGIKLMGPIFVIVALTLIGFVVYTYFVHILRHITFGGLAGQIATTAQGLFFVLNALYNYWMTATSDAGKPPEPGDEAQILVEEASDRPKPRICPKCKLTKPMRAHHCTICNRCVLKMDHHCPWMNNCVGAGNYRHFCLFMFFLAQSCGFVVAVCFLAFDDEGTGLEPDEQSCIVASFLISFSILISLCFLGGFHAYLAVSNQTTIEFYGNIHHRRMARKNNQRWVNPYSLGLAGNFQEVFKYPFSNPRWLFPWRALFAARCRSPSTGVVRDV
mmetsp:Transcript_4912/g.16196  ORF Transcript_4912/g.16196 Transcript_4912/m.16196 type:complete len:348 (-) Transcript_4912:49-1092(-)